MDYYAAVRAFLSAAEAGSFSKAALELEVKTSTVSRHIAQLEADLGIALFNRSTRGLVLTEGGRVFREHVRVSMRALDEARQVTAALNASPKGVLRVTLPVSFGRRHVVRHLPEFLDRYPDIDVDAVLSDELLNLIDARIDLAVRIGVLPDSRLMARRLADHRRVVCASPAYVARRGLPARPEDLRDHEGLRFALASDDKWRLVRRAARGGRQREVTVRLNGRLRADDTEALLDLAEAGAGVALLPSWSLGDSLRAGRLVRLLPEWEAHIGGSDPAVWAVYPPKKTVSSKVRAFMDFYADKFAGPDYWPL